MFIINGDSKITTNQQGDIPIVSVSTEFDGKDESVNGRAILALGESTGHMHVIDSPHVRIVRDGDVIAALKKELVEKGLLDPDADTIDAGLIVSGSEPVSLTHDEHDPHLIVPGRYAVLRQREYQPRMLPRRVAD